ncbi:MAG: DUF3137 domain-containing protein [Planctomycetota bacterium]|jgi:hypothetical protein
MKTIEDLRRFYDMTLLPELTHVFEQKREKTLWKRRIGMIVIISCMIPFSITGIRDQPTTSDTFITVVAAFLITFLLWLVVRDYIAKKYVEEFKTEVTCRLSEWIDKNLNFSSNGYIPKSTFIDSGMFHTEPGRQYKGSNLVSLSLDGKDFKFSELIMSNPTLGKYSAFPLFEGIFGVCELDNVFLGRTIVVPSKVTTTYLKSIGKSFSYITDPNERLIDMDHDEFEHYFAVYSKNPSYTKTILSESLVNKMLEFRKATIHENLFVYTSFICHKIFFGAMCGRELLRPKFSGPIIDFRQVEVYFEIMRFASAIVEEVKSNPRIESG